MPIDPVKPVLKDQASSMAPPYVDEDVGLGLVEEGMRGAEDDTRDTVTDAYEATARLSDEAEESLDDIDYMKDEDSSVSPELDAIHEDVIAEDEDEDFEEEE